MKQKIFIASSFGKNELPETELFEIAVCGRSNSGKSSLINTLFNIKNLAHTSSRPGKTKSLNFYNFNDVKILVDLPGFGYAKVSIKEQESWKDFIQDYIFTRKQLHGLIILMDIRRGLQEDEIYFVDELIRLNKFHICLVFTKEDKLKGNELIKKKKEHVADVKKKWENICSVFFTSSLKKLGIDDLKDYIIKLWT